jgi:Calx-beta domain
MNARGAFNFPIERCGSNAPLPLDFLNMAQGVNQFLTPKSYSKLTGYLPAIIDCVISANDRGQSCVCLAFSCSRESSKNPSFHAFFGVFLEWENGVVLCCFGTGDLLDRATIARISALLCFALISLFGEILGAAPAYASDTFPGTVITGNSGSFVDSNVGTTGETGEPLTLGGGALNTQWYSWTAPVTGFVSFGTCNPTGSTLTNFDTTIGVYTGNAVNALTLASTTPNSFNDDTVGCNSVVNPNYGSTVAFTATAGTTYRIQVDGYANTTGQFNLFYGYSGFTTTVTDVSATEGGGTGAFTVVLNAVPTGTATITIGTSTQCTFSPSTLTFTSANWNVAQTVTVTAIDDAIVEGSHFCAPASITPSGGGVASSPAPPPTFTLTDNDTATVSIANTTNGAEAGAVAGVMTVTQSKVSAVDTVIAYTVTGTATSGTDYTALSGSVTILAGATTATITIPVIDDAIVEGNETVIVTLNSVTSGVSTSIGAPTAATNTIADNDAATVSIANTTNGSETGPTNGVMTVTQTAVSATNTVLAYSVSGTATSGTDYTALSGTVTITAGSTTATITIPVINDATAEGNETVIITLTSVTSGLATLGTPVAATNTIADNDAPTVTIANTTNGAETGPVNGVMTVTMSATRPAAVTISYSVTGSATSGSDFTALSGTVTIPALATTATISIPVINDLIVEGNETVIVTLTAITSGVASLGATLVATNTIADNDSATVSIANTTNGAEPSTNGVMTITQTAVSSVNTVIAYSVSGTATNGTDYTALSGTVTVLAGATTAAINIAIIDDLLLDPAETVTVTLTGVSSGLATLGTPLAATNTIADNDVASFTISKAVNAGNVTTPITLTYTITIANTGNIPLTAPVITDTLTQGGALTLTSGPTVTSGDAAPLGTLDVGETWIYTATYAVTQANINTGTTISNVATFDTAETAFSTSNTVTTTITVSPAMTVVKAANTAGPVSAGNVITYTFTVKNTGNVTLSNVNVGDTFNGYGTPPVRANEVLFSDAAPSGDSTDLTANNSIWTALAPGDEVRFTGTYTVVQQDVDLLQ